MSIINECVPIEHTNEVDNYITHEPHFHLRMEALKLRLLIMGFTSHAQFKETKQNNLRHFSSPFTLQINYHMPYVHN